MKNQIILVPCLLLGLLSVFPALAQESTRTGEQNITANQNNQLISRLFGEVFNQHSITAIDDLYAPDVVDHAAFPDQAPGAAGIKSAIKGFFEMFDGLTITVDDMIAEDDKVATRETWRATHRSSGKNASGTVIHIFRIRDGKITEEWSRGWDWLENL
jgi:ketosteroid isomerase-like protein